MVAPEAAVKARVRQLLGEYGDTLYAYWPVPSGFGRTTVDVLCCYRGQFFAIETKAPGKKPTVRQMTILNEVDRAMGRTFVIDDVASPVLGELKAWLDSLRATINDRPHLTPDPVRRRRI